jgi:hypothetical protein
MPFNPASNGDWIEDCLKWRGHVLTGRYTHWCYGWDEFPIDETCEEWPCECAKELMDEVSTESSWKDIDGIIRKVTL